MATKPRSPTGHRSADQSEFILWIGFCITAWAEIESRLFNIFWRCLGSTQEHAAIIYYRTPSVDARLSLVDEIVKSVLPKRSKKDGGHDPHEVKHWTKMVTDLRDHLAIRRRVAHHPMLLQVHIARPIGLNDVPETKEITAWWAIHASNEERLRERAAGQKALTLADLQAHYVDLQGIQVGIGEFLPHRLLPLLQGRVLPSPPLPKARGSGTDQPKEPDRPPRPSSD